MADISKITVENTTYNVKDNTAREGLSNKVDNTDSRLTNARPANGGTADAIKDSGDGRTLHFEYSAAGMSSTSWLGSWNGNTLQAISPDNVTSGNAKKVNGHSVNSDVPSGAVFTDTKLKTATMTLASGSWSGSSAPYSYDLGATYGSKSIIQLNGASCTTAQLEAAQAANIVGSDGTKIYAFGDKPTVDIPVVILYE